MGQVILDMAMSLDGFITGPNDDDAGLHNYFFAPAEATAAVIEQGFKTTGAIIMGRRSYEVGAGQDGFADNPYQVPHFVLSHTQPEKLARGAEAFIFVTDGIASALHQAQAAAGEKAVVIGGGANIARQFLKAGLVEEIQLHLVPVLLGQGIRLFESDNPEPIELETIEVIASTGVTHLKFRVVNKQESANRSIDKSIEIKASVDRIWRVFTDPEVTRQMGGEYVSDWQVGSSFGFKGLDGQMLTNGTILQIEPEKLLQHKLFNSVDSLESVITYEFQEHDSGTTLHSREEFAHPISDEDHAAAVEGWDAALLAVKELAENS